MCVYLPVFTCSILCYAMFCYARSNISHHDQVLFFCVGGFKSKADMANLSACLIESMLL